jgi:hypothetical protein
MNERVVPKKTNFYVVKLSNSPAITCVPRLELDHFESQHDSSRINQRLLRFSTVTLEIKSDSFPVHRDYWVYQPISEAVLAPTTTWVSFCGILALPSLTGILPPMTSARYCGYRGSR